MYPILFKIGGLTIYTHGVLAVFGIVLGSYILFKLAQKEKLNTAVLFDNIVYAVLIGIIGARLTYFFLYRDQFSNFLEILYLWRGGMVSYGGFIFGFATFIALIKAQKSDLHHWLKISAIAFPIGLFWGRIGNIFAGEYAGVVTINKLNFDGSVPVTLYEAVLLAVIAFFLYLIYVKSNKGITKYLFFLFGLSYTAGRFIIDFWRDEDKIIFNLSIGQMTSLILFIFFLITAIYLLTQERRKHYTI